MKVVPLRRERRRQTARCGGNYRRRDRAAGEFARQAARRRVLSVGDGRRLADGSRMPHQVRDGDRVVFASYAGIEVEVDGEAMLIMNEDEILAIVR